MVFLFSDLVDSTGWKQDLGDVAYAEGLLRPHNDLFRELLAAHGGTERTFTGDGFLATFAAPSDAVRFALRLHVALSDRPWGPAVDGAGRRPQTRIGVHLGEALTFPDADPAARQVAGQAVDLTARVMGLAAGGQTLLTRHAFDSARQYVREDGLAWLAHGQYRCKGSDDPVDVCEVGTPGRAPLAAPPDSDKARRVRLDAADDTGSWRPAVGLAIPRREGWRIESHLGAGGFGEVWLARHVRTKEVRVFKFCFDADRLRSFKRELTFFKLIRSELGDRPDIAKLYEINVDAPPYFLEGEYVESGNLVQWAEAQGGLAKVPLDTRLDLVARVARAAAAAHSLGIIHKDLKPSNVLIRTVGGGPPQPQLSDFGIGVLADRTVLERREVTESGFTESVMFGNESSRTGTRLYAPPESQLGKPATTGTDVYALGVMLFQMVVGDLHRPLGTGWEEAVTEDAVGDPVLADLLRGDIATASRADPATRLAGAALLAERLERRAERRGERLAALRQAEAERLAVARGVRVRRLRTLLAISVTGLFMVGVLGIYAWQMKGRADAEADKARTATRVAEAATTQAQTAAADAKQQAHRAETTADFMRQLFNTSDPTGLTGTGLVPAGQRGQKLTVKDLLIEGANKVRAGFREDQDKLLRAALLDTIGDVMRSIGLLNESKPLLDESRDLRSSLPAKHPDVTESVRHLALWHMAAGDVAEALRLLNSALNMHRAAGTLDTLAAAEVKFYMAGQLTLIGDPEAERYAREALKIRKRELGDDNRDTALAKVALAGCLFDLEKGAEVGPLLLSYSAFLEAEAQRHQGDPVLTAAHEFQQSMLSNRAGKPAEAEARVRRAIDLMNKAMGTKDHPYNCIMLADLAGLLQAQGREDEALAEYEKCAGVVKATVGIGYPRAYRLWDAYSALLCKYQKFEDAKALWATALAAHDARYKGTRFRISFLAGAGQCYARAGDLPGAEGLARQLVAQLARTPVRLTRDEVLEIAHLTAALKVHGDFAVLRDLSAGALTSQTREAHPFECAVLLANWADALVARRRCRDAESALAEAGDLLDRSQSAGPEDDALRADIHLVRGKAHWCLGRSHEAAAAFRTAATFGERAGRRGNPADALARLVAVSAGRGRWADLAAATADLKRTPKRIESNRGVLVYLEVAAHRLDPAIDGPGPTPLSVDREIGSLADDDVVAYRARTLALMGENITTEAQHLAAAENGGPATDHVRLARAICALKLGKPEEVGPDLAGLTPGSPDTARDRLADALRALARFRQQSTADSRTALAAARDRALAFLKDTGPGTDPEIPLDTVSLMLELRLLTRQAEAEMAKH
jgi:class 3 adenylate cyclase/tetratricopeptide (TPR) repeat protein